MFFCRSIAICLQTRKMSVYSFRLSIMYHRTQFYLQIQSNHRYSYDSYTRKYSSSLELPKSLYKYTVCTWYIVVKYTHPTLCTCKTTKMNVRTFWNGYRRSIYTPIPIEKEKSFSTFSTSSWYAMYTHWHVNNFKVFGRTDISYIMRKIV